MNCRHCSTVLEHTFVDLGFAPPSNAYLTRDDLQRPELSYPLNVKVCGQCFLVQTEDYAECESLFNKDYAYFSSTSSSWVKHAEQYSVAMINKLQLDKTSFVIEVASNDGYLLKNFVNTGVPCLGIEPTASTAAAAEALDIPVLREFFGQTLAQKLASQGQQADLIIGNNVYAHVPDINDFTRGLKDVLKTDGTITLEFPHLLQLIAGSQFDTIYHEHFSYLSLHTVSRIFSSVGLRIFDVEELPTHGGSLRIYGCHEKDARTTNLTVQQLLQKELEAGLQTLAPYLSFQTKANQIKNNFLSFLLEQKFAGKSVAAYGAAAKGNTLLNYAGVKPDLLSFVCDAAPAKQNKFMPGSHIPILTPEMLNHCRPDYLVILPWNIAAEVISLNQHLAMQGTHFVVAVPQLKIL